MFLIVHILIAILSIIYTGYTLISPTKNKINASYFFVMTTIGSGSYLIFLNSSHLVGACISGLFYLGVVSVGILIARKKLAKISG